MGYAGQDHSKVPEVQDATARILRAILDAGKYAGHFALSADVGKSILDLIIIINKYTGHFELTLLLCNTSGTKIPTRIPFCELRC